GRAAIASALSATTNQRNTGAIICAERLGLRRMSVFEFEKPSRHSSGRSDGSSSFEKATTIDLERLWLHEAIALPHQRWVKADPALTPVCEAMFRRIFSKAPTRRIARRKLRDAVRSVRPSAIAC